MDWLNQFNPLKGKTEEEKQAELLQTQPQQPQQGFFSRFNPMNIFKGGKRKPTKKRKPIKKKTKRK
jgi:hypothetical protein